MGAYYNDNDPFVAQWLENLIAHGQLPAGSVDRRSITELSATDVAGRGQRHFFAGIGGWPYALRRAGIPDDADIWTGSCPCQGLSDAGARRGFLDPRHLWPAWFALIEQCRPPVILGEQVASALGFQWLDLVFSDLERCGYAVGAADLCAAGVGAPHQRQRLFFVAFTPGDRRLEGLRLLVPGGRSQSGLPEVDRGSEDGLVGHARGDRDRQHGRELPGDEGQHDERTAHRDHAPVTTSADSGMADAHRYASQHDGDPGVVERSVRSPARHSARDRHQDSGMADASGTGSQDGRPTQPVIDHRAAGRVVNADSQLRERGERARREERDWVEFRGGARRPVPRDLIPAGATAGFWADADWILCRDPTSGPPVARPVEPGTFPLAHGVSGRVGLLRGYGNAITTEVAVVFIQAFLDALALASGKADVHDADRDPG